MQTLSDFRSEWNSADPCITVHTSGSTGEPKPMRVEKQRMVASARKTLHFLGLKEGDSALLCMPLDFIAGKMMVVRSIVGGLRLIAVEPSGRPLHGLKEVPDFAAMVPMQVYNSLQTPEERDILRRIPNLIIGGGAIDDALEAELSTFPNAIWSTYGMTETLSHIAMRRISATYQPSRFSPNSRFSQHSQFSQFSQHSRFSQHSHPFYHPLPGVSVSLNDDHCLVIDAPDVCPTTLTTNDIAELSADGNAFRILGRRDNVICSGGIKIHIEEVERLLKPHISRPFLITRCPDHKFGEAVAMLVETPQSIAAATYDSPEQDNPTSAIADICLRVLPKYYRPRHIIPVDVIPMTATGKPARKEAERLAAAASQHANTILPRH